LMRSTEIASFGHLVDAGEERGWNG